jgi:Sulfotransferase family
MLHGISGPPPVLIHLHIRKTGGTSLNSAIKHAFGRHEVFELYAEGAHEQLPLHTSLDIASLAAVSKALDTFGLDRVRYMSGHVPFGVHRLFGDRAKYVTLVRDPIERVISHFFEERPVYQAGKPLSFEEYVETERDPFLNNYQVRVLSDAADLNGSLGLHDAAMSNTPRELAFGPPVEARHLEQAKQNIERHFLVAAPLEQLMPSALMLRMMYDWPMWRLQNEYKHKGQHRPLTAELSSTLIAMIARNNAYDTQLYEWVKSWFAAQRRRLEPQLSKDLERFQRINRILTSLGKYMPHDVRKRIAAVVLHGRATPIDLLLDVQTLLLRNKIFRSGEKGSAPGTCGDFRNGS